MSIPNIIYEKKFPQILMEECEELDEKEIETSVSSHRRNSAEICKQLFESMVHVMMPERVENIDHFVKMAQELAEFYEMDTTVIEYSDKIVASFFVNTYNTFSGLKKIILFSDDVGFRLEGNRIILDIFYYTHATFRNGKKVIPCNDLSFLE